jgi:hypothetical protein
MKQETEFNSESFFPSTKRNRSSIKDDSVLVTPNDPSSHHDYLSENCRIELTSTSNKHVLRGESRIPRNTNQTPAPFTERTLKEQVL